MGLLKSIKNKIKKRKARKLSNARKANKRHGFMHGGCMGRNLSAIFIPPRRGKLKGYMR